MSIVTWGKALYRGLKGGITATKTATKVAKLDISAAKMKEIGKILGKSKPEETYSAGRILKMQNAKKGRQIVNESVPTAQKIEEMFNFEKIDRANATGWYDKKKAADALFAFKHGTPIEHVRVQSRPTKEVIEELVDVKKIDELKKAEALGELTQAQKARRLEILEAFENHTDGLEEATILVEKVKAREFKAGENIAKVARKVSVDINPDLFKAVKVKK